MTLIERLQALTAPDRELVTMLVKSVIFADWAAGEGITPVESEGVEAPEDFLFTYWTACGKPADENLAVSALERLATLTAKEASNA